MKDFFDRTEVLKILQGFNPWWTGRAFTVKPFKRVAYDVCKALLADTQLKRAVLLCGPRRVGKTVILTQLADTMLKDRPAKSVFYLSLDHPILKLLTLDEILSIYHENIYPENKPSVLLLDEIHYSKEWELYVKQLVDHRPQYRILATGSATVSHLRKSAESGTGRWTKVPIPSLSFFEFAKITEAKACEKIWDEPIIKLFSMKPGELSLLADQFSLLMPMFRRYLVVGGFPETASLSNDTAFCQRLLREDVVERVLKRDMTALFGVRNINELEKLFIFLCLHSGGIFSVNGCASALETSPVTVSNHLELLADAYLIYRLPPMQLSGKKILKARNKIYLADAALRNAVLLRGDEILDNPLEMGAVVETTVLRHLYAYYYQETPKISYWRDAKTEKEVDIIVQSPKTVLPVEVKYRNDPSISQDDGLLTLCQKEKVPRAYVITQRPQDFNVTELEGSKTKVLRIPAHIFCYLIGQGEHRQWDT